MNLYPTLFSKIIIVALGLMLFFLPSCKEEDNPSEPSIIDYGYHIAINTPLANSNFFLGDTIPIAISFSSETGEIVHFINVEIYSKTAQDLSLYSVLSHQHVPELFEYSDNFVLKDSSKIETGKDWILKATMWSHDTTPDTLSIIQEFEIES